MLPKSGEKDGEIANLYFEEFETVARARGDTTALVSPDGEAISWRGLAGRVAERAATFGRDKTLVTIEARRTVETVTAYLAALVGGHAVAMLPPDADAAWDTFIAAYRPQFTLRGRGSDWRCDRLLDAPADPLHPDLALILSTSGSTGSGKCVRLSRGNLDANARAIAQYLALRPDDRAALLLPLNYCYGLSVVHSHLVAGASVSLAHGSVTDHSFLDGLRRHGCTNLAGVPHTYRLLEEVGLREAGLPALRFMTVAGGRLEPDLVAAYADHMAARGGRFFVMYGQTEATSRMAFVPPEQLRGNEDRIGIAIPGGALRVVDAEGREITEPDEPGELVYRGPNVMMGYAQGGADLARGAEVDELRTGDLGSRDAAGLFRVVGRLRRMSKISGLRISHDALEQALSRAGIEAAVVGDDRAVLALHTSDRADETVRTLLAKASGLPRLAVRAERVAALPRLPSGKVDYQNARTYLVRQDTAPAADIRTLYEEVFAPQAVTGGDTFISLGGDSLRFVQLSISLEQRLGELPEGWERLPVAEMEKLDRATSGWPSVSSDLVIRALAILMVVVHHATHWPIPGGAAAMYLLVGYSLSRLQGDALASGMVGRLFRALPLVLIPYYLVLAAYALAWGEVPWASVFLVGNLGFASPADHTMLPFLYWFVEIYVQTLLLVGALFLIPAVRDRVRARPFAFALTLIAVGWALRFGLAESWSFGGRQIFTIPWNFYIFAFGWAVAVARTGRERLTILGLAAVTFPLAAYYGGNWTGAWIKFMMQFAIIAILLYAPRVRLPRPAVVAGLFFAAAGYHVYLFHRIIPDHAPELLGGEVRGPAFVILSIVVGIATGIAAFELYKAAQRLLQKVRMRLAGPGWPSIEWR